MQTTCYNRNFGTDVCNKTCPFRNECIKYYEKTGYVPWEEKTRKIKEQKTRKNKDIHH